MPTKEENVPSNPIAIVDAPEKNILRINLSFLDLIKLF